MAITYQKVTEIQPDTTYYTYDEETGVYTPVQSPSQENIGEYYVASETIDYGISYDNYTDLPQPNNAASKYMDFYETGITNVVIGAGAPVSEVEMNEIQELIQQQINLSQKVTQSLFGFTSESENAIFVMSNDYTADEASGATTGRTYTISYNNDIIAKIKNKYIKMSPVFDYSRPSTSTRTYLAFAFEFKIKTSSTQDYVYKYGFNGNVHNSLQILYSNDSSSRNYIYNTHLDKGVVEKETSRRASFEYKLLESTTLSGIQAAINSEQQAGKWCIYFGYIDYSTGSAKVVYSDDTTYGKTVVVDETVAQSGQFKKHSHDIVPCILQKANWSYSSTTKIYSQSVTVSALANYDINRPIIDAQISTNRDQGLKDQYAWDCVTRIDVTGTTVTAYCYKDKPDQNIVLYIKVV